VSTSLLTGLTFVVIALAADAKRVSQSLSLGFGAAGLIGIHNAWDIAVWNTVQNKGGPEVRP
jgi:hypothetical protein